MQSLRHMAFQALRWSEHFFKLDMVYAVKGGLWTTLSFAVSTLASIASMIAFGNLLPRETYGTYSYLLSLGASLSFFTLSGTGIAVMRAVARGHENVVPAALRLQLKYNLLAIATVLSAAFYYGYKGNLLFAWTLAMLAVAYPLAEAFHLYVNIFTGKKRFDLLTKIGSTITLLSTCATIAVLFVTNNILVLIAIYAIMSLVPNIFVYMMAAKNLNTTPPDPEQIQEMKRTAFHVTGSGFVGIIASYIDKIMLFQVAGPAALAVYGFSIAGPDRLKSLAKNWVSIAMPNLAQRTLAEIRHALYKRIGFSLIIGAALCLVYLIFAPLLFKLFLPLYLDAIPYSQAYALSIIMAPPIIYIGSIFASQNMLRAIYAMSTGSQIIRIALFLTFGFFWQAWGLIIASLLSSVINVIYGIIIWEIEIRRLMKKQ